jgi:hypothetical protein
MGEHSVKNIAQPVRAFRVRFEGASEPSEPANAISPAIAPTAEPAMADRVAVELAFWETVKDSADPTELNAYLERYPDGAFAGLARTRCETALQSTEAGEPPEQAAIELAFWQSVSEGDDPSLYEAYLEKYPEGEFASLARLRLAPPTA